MSKSPHSSRVRQFFDDLAPAYWQRYSSRKPYLAYWFGERLDGALMDVDFSDQRVLDVGAGSGALFDLLKAKYPSAIYFATDISAAMLAHSNIPAEKYRVGTLPDWQTSVRFDYIFMLGLMSYLEPDDAEEHLRWAKMHLASGGSLCISFTNQDSWEVTLRRLLRPLTGIFPGKGLIQQAFSIQAHKLTEVKKQFKNRGWLVEQEDYLAASFPFLQHISPVWAAKFGSWLNHRIRSGPWRARLCPEFMLHLVLP